MSRPTDVAERGEEIYDRLAPLAYADEANGWGLLILCGAIGNREQVVHDLVAETDDDPSWSALFDVDRCPAPFLPWLAQLVGERVPVGEGETAARDRIRTPQGIVRGTLPGIVAAAQRTLSGAKTVLLIERDGSPYRLTVVTRKSETPGVATDDLVGTIDSQVGTFAEIDPSGDITNRTLQASKPAGLILTHLVVTGTIVQELAGTIDALTGTIDAL